MFFEIENTPEHIRKARRKTVIRRESPKEECPRLVLAPFSRPPQVIFDNVLIGSTCTKELEVYNPSKQSQKICLGKAMPPGFFVHLPGEWMELEPETCYGLTLEWTPTEPTALRETIRFTNELRGRYDVTIILKSVMNVKGKGYQIKGYKVSPGKIRKKSSKRSPVSVYKKKTNIIYNATTQVKKSVDIVHTEYRMLKTSNKENMPAYAEYDLEPLPQKCPFDSPNSNDFNFSELFSNMRRPTEKSYANQISPPHQNVLQPSKKLMCNNSESDIFDNLTFTPMKTVPLKSDKLDKGPKIVLSMNSDSELDDSLNVKENETHSIIQIASQPPNTWLNVHEHHLQLNSECIETPNIKKHPNTSSPKEMNSPNFSINTELSRISDMSFFPQRCSTERKIIPKINNETRDIFEMPTKVSSDTFTKDSPNTPRYMQQPQPDPRPAHFFLKENPKMCRQSLFKDNQLLNYNICDSNYCNPQDLNVWQNQLRSESNSPPRSLSPPLQSIPEESAHFSETHIFDKTDTERATFTINRTFDKLPDRNSMSSSNRRLTWSKRAVKAEPEIWKVPVLPLPRKSMKMRTSSSAKESLNGKESNVFNKSCNQNVSLNHIGNIYSQSFTVDPFSSSTYFYDEQAVSSFEKEFKRWLNCILTPPADLDSNIEQKIDVGKAWIENRNKEVPAAPTKEQVSSMYHNSHRLESLRRAAKALLLSPEIVQVSQKLTAQIEKKLIAIRNDRNLHLDIGLQKTIMELLLSYNPLWLRIGLEAIYNLVLPLKSNSDIEGLTTFIIQRMFKNPFLKNKNSKSSAPNMLLPAYMEAIKKFTLKKFFILVFFLDQAKQRKLVSHDPCLFCRNAICKESREVIIRFTKELIAGIGDITKHLRPLGYVVSHKQSYLDEYKYAVHNIAVDIRDGVRLTKVMEIILMKNGLLNQLRTPAISRLQKIHNVQVALTALKEANFVIEGDITANDIADGHREKTLSLLWQIIHVFRAPLFVKAANVIQIWWRKKYEVIVEKRKEEERIREKLNNAAGVIQCWWRKIQYNRLVEHQMRQIVAATIIIQKFCRMWLCRTRHRKLKTSVMKIEEWYHSIRLTREAKKTLENLKFQREELKRKSAIIIQSYVKRWLCVKQYNDKVKKIVLLQSLIRAFLIKKWYSQLKASVVYVQRLYRGKLQMRLEMEALAEKRRSALRIQSYYRMYKQREYFLQLKKSVRAIEERYVALTKMRKERQSYIDLKLAVIKMQSYYRGKVVRENYKKQRTSIINLQTKIRAYLKMRRERTQYTHVKNAALTLQKHFRAYLKMKNVQKQYVNQRVKVILIQRYFRSYLLKKLQRQSFIELRNAVITLQKYYRGLLAMRSERKKFEQLRNAVVVIQRRYRALILIKKEKETYQNLRSATVTIQRRYRAQVNMRIQRSKYIQIRTACVIIQNAFRAHVQKKLHRQNFLQQKNAAVVIQNWFRSCRKTKEVKQHYELTRQACIKIQTTFRSFVIARKQRQQYLQIRTATVCIQKYYRCFVEMKTVRNQYIQLKEATVTIQRFYKSYLEMKIHKEQYLKIKSAALRIQQYYRLYKLTQITRQRYLLLKTSTLLVQRRYRALCCARKVRNDFVNLKQKVLTIQQKYRAIRTMRVQREAYLQLRAATIIIQNRYRAQQLMQKERSRYQTILRSCCTIQTHYRACVMSRVHRQEYLKYRHAAITVQNRYRALIAMRSARTSFLSTRAAVVAIQLRFRARCLMVKQRSEFLKIVRASVTIQRRFKAYLLCKQQRSTYIRIKTATIIIQRWYRNIMETRRIRRDYQLLRKTVVAVQRRFRMKMHVRQITRHESAKKIQMWYRATQKRNECRNEYLKLKTSAIVVQSIIRMYILRKTFLAIRNATLTIQKYFRTYKQTAMTRQRYILIRTSTITLQSYVRRYIERRRYLNIQSAVLKIQTAYRLKRERDLLKKQREIAAICIQKNIRRYLTQTRYEKYRQQVIYIQKLWRGKLITRLQRCEFLQKRRILTKLQAIMRGYLVRKKVQLTKLDLMKKREEQKRNWAASKIQALFRGHHSRSAVSDGRVSALRRRWRGGALRSTQESLRARNHEAMELLSTMTDIETIIRVFRSLALLTEVMPMTYNSCASSVVRRVYTYMSVMNRSISSVEVLKYAAAILVNLTRYKVTGAKIYKRDRIPPILKFMWRFSNSETDLFCILCTYLWLFAKYDAVKQDLAEFLRTPEYHKILVAIKNNVERMKRMETNSRTKLNTPQPSKFISHTGNNLNYSLCSNSSSKSDSHYHKLPALEPDFGIIRADKPRYFEDPLQAITCLFNTYNL